VNSKDSQKGNTQGILWRNQGIVKIQSNPKENRIHYSQMYKWKCTAAFFAGWFVCGCFQFSGEKRKGFLSQVAGYVTPG